MTTPTDGGARVLSEYDASVKRYGSAGFHCFQATSDVHVFSANTTFKSSGAVELSLATFSRASALALADDLERMAADLRAKVAAAPSAPAGDAPRRRGIRARWRPRQSVRAVHMRALQGVSTRDASAPLGVRARSIPVTHPQSFDQPKTKTETMRAVVCRNCDHVEVNPLDTWRCKACKHTNVLDVTEVPVR